MIQPGELKQGSLSGVLLLTMCRGDDMVSRGVWTAGMAAAAVGRYFELADREERWELEGWAGCIVWWPGEVGVVG